MALPGVTIPGLSRPGSDGNKEVFCIPQNSCITGTSQSDCLKSYPEHSLDGVGCFTPSPDVQSVYSTVPADWVNDDREYGNIFWVIRTAKELILIFFLF